MRGLPCFTCRKRLDLMLLLSAIGFVSLECMQDLFLNLKQMLRNIYKCTIFKTGRKKNSNKGQCFYQYHNVHFGNYYADVQNLLEHVYFKEMKTVDCDFAKETKYF